MPHKCQWHWYNHVFNCSKSSRVQSEPAEPAEKTIHQPTTLDLEIEAHRGLLPVYELNWIEACIINNKYGGDGLIQKRKCTSERGYKTNSSVYIGHKILTHHRVAWPPFSWTLKISKIEHVQNSLQKKMHNIYQSHNVTYTSHTYTDTHTNKHAQSFQGAAVGGTSRRFTGLRYFEPKELI